MAVVDVEYVSNEMQEFGLNCWAIRDGKNLISEQDNEDMPVTDSASLLLNKLAGVRASFITVSLSGVSKKNRRAAETHKVRTYTVDLRSAGNVSAVPVAIAGPSNDSSEKLRAEILQLRETVIKQEYETKLKDLQKQITDLKNGDDDSIGSLVKQFAPQIATMLGAAFAAPGNGGNTINGLDDASQLIERWRALDADYLKVLAGIVDVAENQPAAYKQYSNILLAS